MLLSVDSTTSRRVLLSLDALRSLGILSEAEGRVEGLRDPADRPLRLRRMRAGGGPPLRVTRPRGVGMRWKSLAVALLVGVAVPRAACAEVDHVAWDQLLRRYVRSGLVDYQGLSAQRHILDGYLARLSEVNAETLPSRNEQLAFWINAYNACVIKGVLEHYPLRSVKEVKGFFDRLRYRVARQDLTLNEIERHGRAVGDFRIHFALVCASSSCPPLHNEAYLPKRLDEQLAEQAKGFLADPQRGLRVEGATLWASQIFKWYAKDFVSGRLTPSALLSVLAPQLPVALRAAQGEPLTLKWLDYDWTLNERREVR